MGCRSQRFQSSPQAHQLRCGILFDPEIPSLARNIGLWPVRRAGLDSALVETIHSHRAVFSPESLRAWAHRLDVYVPAAHVLSTTGGSNTSGLAGGSRSCLPSPGTGNSLGCWESKCAALSVTFSLSSSILHC